MPNQRAPGKRLMGAMMAPELWDAIDKWLESHPRSNQSEFLLLAVLEKLANEGININREEALRDKRTRVRFKSNAYRLQKEREAAALNDKSKP